MLRCLKNKQQVCIRRFGSPASNMATDSVRRLWLKQLPYGTEGAFLLKSEELPEFLSSQNERCRGAVENCFSLNENLSRKQIKIRKIKADLQLPETLDFLQQSGCLNALYGRTSADRPKGKLSPKTPSLSVALSTAREKTPKLGTWLHLPFKRGIEIKRNLNIFDLALPIIRDEAFSFHYGDLGFQTSQFSLQGHEVGIHIS